jgi:hypothetical protein
VESGLPKSNDSDRDYHKVTRQLHPDDKCPSGNSSDPSVIPEGKTGTVHLDDKGVHPPRLRSMLRLTGHAFPFGTKLYGCVCAVLVLLLPPLEITATNDGNFRWFALRAADVVTVDHAGRSTLRRPRCTFAYADPRPTKMAKLPHACCSGLATASCAPYWERLSFLEQGKTYLLVYQSLPTCPSAARPSSYRLGRWRAQSRTQHYEPAATPNHSAHTQCAQAARRICTEQALTRSRYSSTGGGRPTPSRSTLAYARNQLQRPPRGWSAGPNCQQLSSDASTPLMGGGSATVQLGHLLQPAQHAVTEYRLTICPHSRSHAVV